MNVREYKKESIEAREITHQQILDELSFNLAREKAVELFLHGIISLEEYHKLIGNLAQKYKPFLFEIMD